jgi:predicted nucleic acid-binding protein
MEGSARWNLVVSRTTDDLDQLPGGHEATDPDDAWLLALANAGRADHLATGHKRSWLLAGPASARPAS